jgi:hypothetical protein
MRFWQAVLGLKPDALFLRGIATENHDARRAWLRLQRNTLPDGRGSELKTMILDLRGSGSAKNRIDAGNHLASYVFVVMMCVGSI